MLGAISCQRLAEAGVNVIQRSAGKDAPAVIVVIRAVGAVLRQRVLIIELARLVLKQECR